MWVEFKGTNQSQLFNLDNVTKIWIRDEESELGYCTLVFDDRSVYTSGYKEVNLTLENIMYGIKSMYNLVIIIV